MLNTELTRLSEKVIKNRFEYQLVKRDDHRCIYAQTKKGKIYAYEVFKPRIRPWHLKANRPGVHELFPCDDDFGRIAWTYRTLGDAEKRYETLAKVA